MVFGYNSVDGFEFVFEISRGEFFVFFEVIFVFEKLSYDRGRLYLTVAVVEEERTVFFFFGIVVFV